MNKIINKIFCLIFFILLTAPAVCINLKKDYKSMIDNAYLPELYVDKNTPLQKQIYDIENYINKRIGFREESLTIYQKLHDKLFGIMIHPIYMYEKNRHVFFSNDSYIKDFQHLNLDQQFAKKFATKMQEFSNISRLFDAGFICMVIPDKKTIYAEYFPDGINIYGDISRTDQVLDSLEKAGVNWFYPYNILNQSKIHMLVNNIMYDAGHWNQNGAFVAIQELYKYISEKYKININLSLNDYNVYMKKVTSLQVSRFPINEFVPNYKLKNSNATLDNDWFENYRLFKSENLYKNRYINQTKTNLHNILIFHDSYLYGNEIFFTEHFNEITFLHRDHIITNDDFKFYLSIIRPDIVIYEIVQRSLRPPSLSFKL